MKLNLALVVAIASISFTGLAHSVEKHKGDTHAEPQKGKPETEVKYMDERDPFESFNRAMWNLNYNYLDRYVLRPVAHGYNDYVPNFMQDGVDNFVHNLDEPSSLVNNTLQGKWKWALNAGGRFTINSTFGILGLVDVADKMGLPRKQDEFAEVLGYYGVPNGPYFMLPAYGPTVTRELASNWVDDLYFPLSDLNFWQKVAKVGLDGINTRVKAIPQEKLLDNALDPYTFVKDAYLQHLDFKLHDGRVTQKQGDDELINDYLDELN
ncbi:VacJ family lipoprotein [Shewanella sp. 202IG2-18]|uniref:MlaA family lipoprotein n=1 Tax=Parashewanella hymeniacidonis TaxID=2807618 RepID=UPI0019609861|nr:VacJ family lipoprotein [Parashewanella hymeniacidonis]MBM7072086.1 VacJ family lipoprotein [Parashewanella hymeniacidonis]